MTSFWAFVGLYCKLWRRKMTLSKTKLLIFLESQCKYGSIFSSWAIPTILTFRAYFPALRRCWISFLRSWIIFLSLLPVNLSCFDEHSLSSVRDVRYFCNFAFLLCLFYGLFIFPYGLFLVSEILFVAQLVLPFSFVPLSGNETSSPYSWKFWREFLLKKP